jgi:hypothetical protein
MAKKKKLPYRAFEGPRKTSYALTGHEGVVAHGAVNRQLDAGSAADRL